MRRIRQDLSALFGSRGPPAVSTLGSWACAALACRAYQLMSQNGYGGAARAAFALCLPALFLAYWLGAGALAFQVDAKHSYLPGAERLVHRAALLAALLLLPALVLPIVALTGVSLWWAWLPTALVLELAIAGFMAPRLLPLSNWVRIALQGWLETDGAARSQSLLRRQPAARIVRICLGGMFVRLSARQRTVGAALLALLTLAAIGQPWLGASGWSWVISISALATAGLISGEFLMQISKLTREGLAEVALMPGLGSPARQRRALCRVVLLHPLSWLGSILLLGSTGLLLEGAPLSMIGVLSLCILIVWLTYVVFALQKLLTLPSKRNSLIAEILRVYTYVFPVLPYWDSHAYARLVDMHWWLWWSVPTLIAVTIAGVIGFSLKQLAATPHPFVVRESRGLWARLHPIDLGARSPLR